MIVLSILQCILYLLIIPACLGIAFTRHFDEKYNTLGNILVCGFMGELTVFQILFLIFYRFDRNLTELTIASSLILVILSVLSAVLNFKNFKKIKKPGLDMGFGVLVLFTLYMAVMRNIQGISDGDDAYVIGNALTTYTTGYFYKTDYYTGHQLSSESYLRHFLASTPIFISYMSKLTGIHPLIMAHRILGSFYLILHNCLLYNLAIALFKDEKKQYRSIFASFAALMTVWDFHSFLTDSTFILSRTWQGKAMFCAFIVPLSLILLVMMGECEGKKKILYLLEVILCFASVAMTPAAIYLFSLLMFVGSLCVAISVKKVSLFLKSCVALMPMVAFGAFYYIVVH